ncbi:MAG: hypothetical protein LBB68_06550 [Treponema sp.]|jgi:hypothetical protein|nr:hypothetical protein [Treponema sp.]
MADYIPDKDADFDTWFSFLYQYVSQKCAGPAPAWTHIPQAALGVLAELHAGWKTAYSGVIGPHTKVDTEAKNNAKKAAKGGIRPFVNQYLRFFPVTNKDRTAMGVPNHDEHPTPVPVPEDVPETEAAMPLPRVLQFRFRRANAKRWGKPPPKEIEDLVHSSFATRSPLDLTFKESDRGKKLYYAVRWETGTVKKGKWSEIMSAIIP